MDPDQPEEMESSSPDPFETAFMEEFEDEYFNPDEPLQADDQQDDEDKHKDDEEKHSEDESEAGSSKRARYATKFKVMLLLIVMY